MPEPTVPPANQADFIFRVAELPSEELKVTGFVGNEEISRLFSFRVELCSLNADVAFDQVVGQPCTLEIVSINGSRFVNGIVRRFERTGEGVHLTYYSAEIVPLHWLLTRRYKSRIFQSHNCSDMTAGGVIKKVLDDAGIPTDNYRFALQGTYATREYVVQYRESEMDFISRLAEEEGIFFFFEHSAEGHVLVFGDTPTAHTAAPGAETCTFRERTGMVTEQGKEFIYHVRDRVDVQTGAVMLDDYNFKQPANELKSTVTGSEYTSLEFSDYPGGYIDKTVGDTLARVRLEEFQCVKRVQHMRSVVRALLPGFTFTMEEHPTTTLNRDYLVTRITHRAVQPQSGEDETRGNLGIEYSADFDTIAADVPFRPARRTTRPTVLGSQTALVVGPSGEEIYTDEYGRVKVQFHWDREGEENENSSCFIRVSQGMAGGNYGHMFLPRVGQEVIVDFLEGDPDQPIITGRVYNNDNMPPYGLPDEKTKSTIKTRSTPGGGGFNELRFEDKKDSEQIFMHGQKDLDIRILNDEKDWIGRDKHEIIKGNQAKSIGGAEGRSVGGDQNTTVGGNRSVDITGTNCVYSTSNHTLASDADLYGVGAKVGLVGDSYIGLDAPSIMIEGSTITLKGGGGSVVIDASGVSITGTVVKINSGGAAGPAQSVAIADCYDPAAPLEAATGDPGQDFTYQPQPSPYDPFEHDALHNEDEANEDQTHWIGIRLYDDNGQPLSGERYAIQLPDGSTVARGVTNAKGEVEVKGIDPGNCQVTFPDLDGMTWEPGPPQGGTGGEAATAGAAAPAATGAPAGAPVGGNGMPV